MSGWMLMFLLIFGAFVLLLGLKLFPVYLESFKIDKALRGVIEQSDIGQRSKREISLALTRRLDIDDVRSVNEGNFQKFGKITKKGNRVIIEIVYEKVEPLVGNLSLLATFEKRVEN
jgi:hypothetical protein